MTINELQDEVIEEFELFDNWEDKYAYLIDLGKKLAPLADEYKIDKHKIKGCQSNVWMNTYLNDEKKVVFEGDSDALIVKGLVSLLIRVLSEQSPAEIAHSDLYYIEKIGMKNYLSMTRANGLAAMIKQMKLFALAYQSRLNGEG